MSSNKEMILRCLFRSCAGIAVLALLLTGSGTPLAQSSVEKAETSQQAKQQENELELARKAVAKPGDQPAQPETGRIWGDYSVQSSLEVGYRFEDTSGNRDRFLSDVNVRDGFRVLEYTLDSRAITGEGLLYDLLRADVNNAGGDQSQNFSLRMDKRRAYRFEANVRRFNYFRVPGPEFALGLRTHDLRQQISDYSLKLFPQRAVRLNFGYWRSMAKGRYSPTYSYERDLFGLIGRSRWEANDYRAGLDATWHGWDFAAEHLYRSFKNDPLITAKVGGDPGYFGTSSSYPGAISLLDRETPLRGHSLVTRGSMRGSIGGRLHVVLRGLRDEERMRAPYYELSQGTTSNNATILSRLLVTGNNGGIIKRPNNVVDAGATFDINDRLSVSNAFRYNSFKIMGDVNTLQTSQLRLGSGAQQTVTVTTVGRQLTDLTSYWNTLELNLHFGRKFSGNLGWRAMRRDVTLNGLYTATTVTIPSSSSPTVSNISSDESESVTTHAFVGGVRFRTSNRTSFFFDVEHGANNNAFVRINPLEFTRFRVRTQIQATNALSLTGVFTSTDRMNPTPQVNNNSNSRSYTVAINWEPNARVWLNVGYNYHDLYSTADISYFLVGVPATNPLRGRSLYYARMNNVFVNTRFALTSRLDVMLFYYSIMDRGAPTLTLGTNDFVTALPLRRYNPELRASYRFSNLVTGSLSYRHYSYNERDTATQDYRSNIVTISTRFTF